MRMQQTFKKDTTNEYENSKHKKVEVSIGTGLQAVRSQADQMIHYTILI